MEVFGVLKSNKTKYKSELKHKMSSYNPPICVVNNEAYDRMYASLQNGERYVKSYLNTCPHKNKDDCKCKYFLNFLQDNKMVRVVNGELKDVISETEFIQKYGAIATYKIVK